MHCNDFVRYYISQKIWYFRRLLTEQQPMSVQGLQQSI